VTCSERTSEFYIISLANGTERKAGSIAVPKMSDTKKEEEVEEGKIGNTATN
jgi:hypothetical protein